MSEVNAGASQGSALESTLWDILCDGLLELMTTGLMSSAYADHLAVAVEAQDKRELMFKTNVMVETISEWLESKNLGKASQKSIIQRSTRR